MPKIERKRGRIGSLCHSSIGCKEAEVYEGFDDLMIGSVGFVKIMSRHVVVSWIMRAFGLICAELCSFSSPCMNAAGENVMNVIGGAEPETLNRSSHGW